MDGEVVGRVLMMGYDGLLNANQSMSSIWCIRWLIDSKNVALPFTWKELGKSYIADDLELCELADCYR
jgi:hypothetical protein